MTSQSKNEEEDPLLEPIKLTLDALSKSTTLPLLIFVGIGLAVFTEQQTFKVIDLQLTLQDAGIIASIVIGALYLNIMRLIWILRQLVEHSKDKELALLLVRSHPWPLNPFFDVKTLSSLTGKDSSGGIWAYTGAILLVSPIIIYSFQFLFIFVLEGAIISSVNERTCEIEWPEWRVWVSTIFLYVVFICGGMPGLACFFYLEEQYKFFNEQDSKARSDSMAIGFGIISILVICFEAGKVVLNLGSGPLRNCLPF